MVKRAKPRTEPTDPARSAQMALIRAKNTQPEMLVRSALHAAGLRFRLHDATLPGKPDILLPSRRIAVQVHGCFWHRHSDPNCKLARLPKSRLEFWVPKLDANRERDRRNGDALRALGWDMRVIWECEARGKGALSRFVEACKAVPVRSPRGKLS